MAKTRVAPVKKLTIPRRELLGAIEGLGLARIVSRELELDISKVVFHTDSQVVLTLSLPMTCKSRSSPFPVEFQ